jgi:hypothetical protein
MAGVRSGDSGSGEPSREVEAREVALLADPTDWSTGATALLADLGFSLINSDRPAAPAGSHLLVAFRAEPTLHHFDPESISFWEPGRDHPARATLVHTELRTGTRPVLWGHVHIVDRLGVENRFLSFGGQLRIALPDSTTAIVDVRSPGPIMRWGGHSQATDELAEEIGAFFGRLILPVDFVPGAEAQIAATSPAGLYSSFLIDTAERYRRIAERGGQPDPIEGWIHAEARRLRADHPDSWAEGGSLLAAIGPLVASPRA